MLKKNEYRLTVRRPYPPLQSSLFLEGFRESSYFYPFFNQEYALDEVIICEDGWYCSDEQLERIGRLTMKEWKKEKDFNRTKQLMLEREKNLLDTKNADIASFCEAFSAYQPAILMISYSEKMLEEFMKKLFLSAGLGAKKIIKMLDILNSPLEDNIYKKEEYDLVNTKNLQRHVKKYSGLYSRYANDREYTLAEAEERLKNINKKKYLDDYKRNKDFLRKKIKEAKNILGKEFRHMVDAYQFSVYYRTQRADILNLSTFNIIPKLKQAAKKFDLSYEEIIHCTSSEILTGDIPNIEEIKNRQIEHGFVMEAGKIRVVTGNEYEKVAKFFKTNHAKKTSFSGTTAYKSNAITGRAKIVLKQKDYQKVKEEDILIASMTTPDMVPLMKKVKAIVTDEGGITCHAAIISRELKKPCIIGTKIATQVLRDGDKVEVDAEKGVVRILNKGK